MKSSGRISLLSALPHSLEEVKSAASNPHNDYVSSKLLKYLSPEVAWKEVRRALEVEAEKLFSWCAEVGVSVVRRAKREDLAKAAQTSDIIVVLSHWKAAELTRNDFRAPVTSLGAAIEVCLARGILRRPYDVVDDKDDRRDCLARDLNQALDRWTEWLSLCLAKPNEQAVISNFYARCMARAEIDKIFEGHILPGARLELYDDLWRPSDIASCFPSDWPGIADFVCCTSLYLSETVKKKCPQAMFRADSRLLKPRVVIPAVHRILEAVCIRGMDYMEAAYSVDAQCGEER